jgi:O-methyltransferase
MKVKASTLPDIIVERIKREVKLMRDPNECKRIYGLALAASTMDGDFAEVGVYQGGSAKLICEARGNKALHLFDTFTGLPEKGEEDWDINDLHTYEASLESVQKYLDGYPNVHYHKGVFPDFDGVSLNDTKFAFVHLDVDLYQSMKDCLEFFVPRMVEGGMIIVNAYPTSSGIVRAFLECSAQRILYNITPIGYRQGLIIN